MKRTREEAKAPGRARKDGNSIPARDHLGRAYPSRAAMCKAWDVSPSVYFNRRRRGWTVEESLTGQGPAKPLPRIVKDHEGRRFPTVKAMCEAWGISPATYGHRRAHGMSVEAALTSPIPDRAARDHTGRKFPTVKAMCDAWGISADAYYARLNRGMSVEAALTAPVHPAPVPSLTTDHTGRVFPSVSAMCRAWGVDDATYRGRRKRGLDVEEALTAPEAPHPRARPCADHTGRSFPTVRAMCRAWNVPVSEYYKRVKLGMSIEEVLTAPARNA